MTTDEIANILSAHADWLQRDEGGTRGRGRMKALSYGGGVQTTALLRMCLAGEFERPDLVVFADTQDEPQAVYASVQREKANCEDHGVPFTIVSEGRLGDALKKRQVMIPAYTRPDGQLFRTCTSRYKIEPIRRHLRSLGAKKVELWFGMSTDEIQRVKPSRAKWIKHRWPLVEMNLRRSDCEAYLLRLGIKPVKSACVYCPLHGRASWDAVRAVPADWQRAVEYDAALRDVRPGLQTFVHRARKPLPDAIADPAPNLFDDECEGVCFS